MTAYRPRWSAPVELPRRQQYRRLSRAAAAAMASGTALLSALVFASAGAVSAAGVMLALAIGLGLYARHWLSLADRSRIGARSEDEVRRALAPRARRGGGCGTRSRGEAAGTSTPWPSRRPGSHSPSRRGRGATTVTTSRGYANRRCGCRGGVGGGAGAAPCPSSAWFAPAAWSGSSRTSWSSRSTGCSRLYEVAQADPSRTSSASGGLLRHGRSRERACIGSLAPGPD
jgi:hypothetical protein